MKQNIKPILAAVLLLLVLFMVGCMPSVRISYYDHSELYQTGNFTYEAWTVDKIYVHWYTGSVQFVESAEDTLSVTESGTDLVEEAKLHWYRNGRELRIEFCASEYGEPIASGDKRLTVEIPADIDLVVSDSAADITLGTHTLGDLDIYSTSGNIYAESLTVREADIGSISGTIRIGTLISDDDAGFITTSGALDVQSLQAKEIDVNSVSGSVTVSEAKVLEEADIETTSGSIRLGILSTKELALSSNSGKIDLGLCYAEKGTVKSVSGEIAISLKELLGITLDHKTVSGKLYCENCDMENNLHKVRDGFCKLQVETTSGNVYVK